MKKVANIDKVTNSNVLWCQDNKMYHVWSVVTQNYASVFLRYIFANIDKVTHSNIFYYDLLWFQTNYTSQQWLRRYLLKIITDHINRDTNWCFVLQIYLYIKYDSNIKEIKLVVLQEEEEIGYMERNWKVGDIFILFFCV